MTWLSSLAIFPRLRTTKALLLVSLAGCHSRRLGQCPARAVKQHVYGGPTPLLFSTHRFISSSQQPNEVGQIRNRKFREVKKPTK